MYAKLKTPAAILLFLLLLGGCGTVKNATEKKQSQFAEIGDLPPFKKTGGLKGQVYNESGVRRIIFPDVIAQHLEADNIYVVQVGESDKLAELPFDYVMNDDLPANYFGYKYTTPDADIEKSRSTNPSFKERFPGQFFASGKAREQDGVYGGALHKFELDNGVKFNPTGTENSAVRFSPDSLYVIVINEPNGFRIDSQGRGQCGDAYIMPWKECDDANQSDGDGCSSNCRVESGWRCSGNPSTCSKAPVQCGNGVVEQGETCDDGNLINGDGCNSLCQMESAQGWVCNGSPSVCRRLFFSSSQSSAALIRYCCNSGSCYEGGAECPYFSLNDCNLECGQTQTRYCCYGGTCQIGGLECPYLDIFECQANCGQPMPRYCCSGGTNPYCYAGDYSCPFYSYQECSQACQ